MFILIMMSKGPIKLTMLQGPFGAINPSQIQQLMQQVGDKNAMFFWAKRVFVKIQKMKTFSEQNATNLASGDGGRKGLEQLIPQLQVIFPITLAFQRENTLLKFRDKHWLISCFLYGSENGESYCVLKPGEAGG